METTEQKPNYKIFHFDTARNTIVDEKFYAENDDAAYQHLLKFKEAHHAEVSADVEHFYKPIIYVSVLGEDCIPEHDVEDYEFCKRWRKDNKRVSKWDNFVEKIDDFLYDVADVFYNIKYKVRDFIYLMKNKEAYSNQWNLDWHLIDTIERNVPSLIKNSHALLFLDEAIKELHKDDSNFDIDNYYRDCQGNFPKEVEDLAINIQNEEYEKLLHHVKLYKYYNDGGYVDYDDPEQVEFDKKWRHTLPIKPGTYDRLADPKKMSDMVNEQWGKIWDWVKQYGQRLSD